MKSNKTKQ